MSSGYLAIVLHAHLPFVRHPEHPAFLEEDWFFEALTESYIPILRVLQRLAEEGIRFRLTLSISPTLAEMMADPLLQSRYLAYLASRMELSEKEMARTVAMLEFHGLARMYHRLFSEALDFFENYARRDLFLIIRQLQIHGGLELMTCPATHAFLPLVSCREAQRAQINVAVQNHLRHFGRQPDGIWLAECGYEPGLEHLLSDAKFRYFILDAHAILYGTPRPIAGTFAPIRTPSGTFAFARDLESSWQVWNLHHGYPGDYFYREFYRDLGYDAEYEYIKPYLQEDGVRRNVGIKYFRITGGNDLSQRAPYDPHQARGAVNSHAAHFVEQRQKQMEQLRSLLGFEPLVVCPYDAELFGHWWFEGPQFLEAVFRHLDTSEGKIRLVHLSEYLAETNHACAQQPTASTWGAEGYNRVWINEKNHWLYRHQHWAEQQMLRLAHHFSNPTPIQERLLNQAARELLLLQSSDWAFMLSRQEFPLYAIRRFHDHLERFSYLEQTLFRNQPPHRLEEIEKVDNLFPELNFRVFHREKKTTTVQTPSIQ
jgi:1,4-alpha-glucan branching enzyme